MFLHVVFNHVKLIFEEENYNRSSKQRGLLATLEREKIMNDLKPNPNNVGN